MFRHKTIGFMVLLAAVYLIALDNTYSQETRASPRSSNQNTTNTSAKLQKGLDPTCGTVDDLAMKVDLCAKPMMDLLSGTVEKWPRTDEDAMKLCESFVGSERCIRDVSRKCARGIQKTIISTLAHSIQRVRKRECSRSKAAAIVKVTTCTEKHNDIIQDWMKNVTGRLTAIEHQTREGDQKIKKICCMVNDIEVEFKALLDPFCPIESAFMNRLYRGVLEDVIELVCRNPKCNNYMKGYKVTKSPNANGLISILLRIVFSLENN